MTELVAEGLGKCMHIRFRIWLNDENTFDRRKYIPIYYLLFTFSSLPA